MPSRKSALPCSTSCLIQTETLPNLYTHEVSWAGDNTTRPGISFAVSELRKKPPRPKRGAAPAPEPALAAPAPAAHERIPLHARIIAWIIWGFAIWGAICAVAILI